MQIVLDSYDGLEKYIENCGLGKWMLVTGRAIEGSRFESALKDICLKLEIELTIFSDYVPNPEEDSAIKGEKLLSENGCGGIIAVGGGSAIDVAKCIKHRSSDRDIKFIAVPTTAGSGSEATGFAVVYNKGIKKSIEAASMIPDAVFMDASFLNNLPRYHKISGALDALCHGVESFWSVNATEVSRDYALEAIAGVLNNLDEYLAGDEKAADKMLEASHWAGMAINISKTTAAHAMSYALTKRYGIAHGHAAAICLETLWKEMYNFEGVSVEDILSRLEEYVVRQGLNGPDVLSAILDRYISEFVADADIRDIEPVAKLINAERLRNYPVELDDAQIRDLYRKIFENRLRC